MNKLIFGGEYKVKSLNTHSYFVKTINQKKKVASVMLMLKSRIVYNRNIGIKCLQRKLSTRTWRNKTIPGSRGLPNLPSEEQQQVLRTCHKLDLEGISNANTEVRFCTYSIPTSSQRFKIGVIIQATLFQRMIGYLQQCTIFA